MLTINKLHSHRVVDFAAEELQKYLRMMAALPQMPIVFDPEATQGFRLGLLSDFGIPFEGEDPELDDVVHIDTDENGGILAGSNYRSVLFAVYRFLKLHGCRFLFPGVDGEYIPRTSLQKQSYHKMADLRYRGHTTEGDPSIQHVLDYIDYHAKQELNTYGLHGIYIYHNRFYKHRFNEQNRPPEPVEEALVMQWKLLCEEEATKRGLQLHDGHHDWVARALGIADRSRFYGPNREEPPAEAVAKMAMLGGKRGVHKGDPNFTNMCMSDPEARRAFVDVFVDYVQSHPHLAAVSCSVADTSHNHCECEACRKKRPSDWLVMILNEIDERLTEKGIPTKIRFGCYIDNMFAPVVERIKNPDRFILNHCPITRTYSSSITPETPIPPVKPYIRNAWEAPKTSEECFAYFKEWRKVFDGTIATFEYHYWKPQFRDPGMMAISRRIYEDMRNLSALGFSGIVEDGSNRSFFPNGFISHIYSATLLDQKLDYEKELADYFLHVYGEDWQQARDYLDRMSAAFDHKYMCGEKSQDASKGRYYDPDHVKSLQTVEQIAAEGKALATAHFAMPTRPQTVTWRLLYRHAQWCEGVANALQYLCVGDHEAYNATLRAFITDFGKHEFEVERYFDLGLASHSLTDLLRLAAVQVL